MTRKCAKCGEELLGAVNRCWRCGTRVESDSSSLLSGMPPSSGAERPIAAAGDSGAGIVVAEAAGAGGGPAPPAVPLLRPDPRRRSAALGGAIAAFVLGLMTVVAGFYTVLAVIPAALGLGLGVWGLFSPRRGPALWGLLLCLLALGISSCNGALALYKRTYGHAPWEVPAEPAEPGG